MARSSAKVDKDAPSAPASPRGREVAGIVLSALAVFLLLSLGSLQLGGGTLMGPVGRAIAVVAYGALGGAAYLVALGLGGAALGLLRGRPLRLRSVEAAGVVGGAVALAILTHLALSSHRLHGYAPGGLIGEYAAEILVVLVGRAGTVILALTGLALATIAATPWTMGELGAFAAGLLRRGLGAASRAAVALFPVAPSAPTLAPARDRSAPREETLLLARPAPPRLRASEETRKVPTPGAPEEVAPPTSEPPPSPHGEATVPVPEAVPVALAERPRRRSRREEPTVVEAPRELTQPVEAGDIVDESGVEAAPSPVAGDDERTESQLVLPSDGEPPPPAIFAPPERKAPSPVLPKPVERGHCARRYKGPDPELLDFDALDRGELDRQAMLELAGRLEKTLADYGVQGRVSEIHPGPVVTMYEFQPKAGTKLSKITSLANDLAMALEALKVRIVAPIPGKAAVGIEVPNKGRETVFLKEIIADEVFLKAKSKLTLALGKDISGAPVAVDLARMPHLLIAGTTGSGKSVSVNGMICSLLFNATPDEVKLIMIDPKMLELSIYEGIPHLLLPVVTDPKKANLALKWAVDEMERRYDLISKSGVRDIASYNKIVGQERPAEATQRLVAETIRVTVRGPGGPTELDVEPSEAAVLAAGGTITEEIRDEISSARAAKQRREIDAAVAAKATEKLPYIVIVIDEFADLMMVASKEVETSVARIAQKARAAGIHLLLATQRPSVDVITGLIKANFPSRVAFQVASRIDARTILDQQGAEALLGMGDMLFMDRGLAPRRVHGPLVTDVEIRRIVDHLKSQGQPVYDLDILKPRDEEGDGGAPAAEERSDEFYDQAVAVVAETRIASVSMVQRRLGVGYNRAAKMIERMEREGIVGPANGSKPREVLVGNHRAA